MEIGLSYDANTKITSGLLGLYDLVASSRLNHLEADLVSLPEMCAHPMLLPLLACNTWHHTMINTFDRTYAKIRRVQQETGMMKGYFDRAPDELRGRAMHGEYEDMHARIVEAHEYSSNVLGYFMNDFSSALQGAFDGPLKILPCEKSASDEARVYSKSLIHRVRVQLNRREQLLASINLQVQVVSSLHHSVKARSIVDGSLAVQPHAAKRQPHKSRDREGKQKRQFGHENAVSHYRHISAPHGSSSMTSQCLDIYG